MCDDVMQLAGDAVALGDDRRLGFGGAGELELLRPGLERSCPVVTVPCAVTE